jgi:hypothetical protein
MRKLGLYTFMCACDSGEDGDGMMDGLFIAEEESVKKIIGTEINFGNIFTDNDEIVIIDDEMIGLLNDEFEFVEKLSEVLDGHWSISGFNPLEYSTLEEYKEDADEYFKELNKTGQPVTV